MTSKFTNFTKAMEKIEEAQRLLQQGPASYYVTEITGAYEYLMGRFAPFKIGDKVMLKNPPDPMPYGWTSVAHFLIRGALAVVKEVECGPNGFSIGVEFEDESWIKKDYATKTEEVILFDSDRKHLYYFKDTAFVKVEV